MEASSSLYALRPSVRPAESSVSIAETAHSLGVHDSLRHGGPRALAAEAEAVHPLQSSLERYEETQQQLKLQLQRNLHGLHAPLRLAMERELVANQTPAFTGLGRPSNIHLDILLGRDEMLAPEEILSVDSARARAATTDFHSAMERKLRM